MSSKSKQDELVRLQTEICQSVLAVIHSDAALRIGERIKAASQGVFIPDSGFASVHMLAALFGLSERSIEDRITDTKPQKYGYGKTALYSLAELTKPKTQTPEPN